MNNGVAETNATAFFKDSITSKQQARGPRHIGLMTGRFHRQSAAR